MKVKDLLVQLWFTEEFLKRGDSLGFESIDAIKTSICKVY